MTIEVARSDVWDVRLPGSNLSLNMNYFDTSRLGVGSFELQAKVLNGTARTNLMDANVTFDLTLAPTAESATEIETGESLRLTIFAHATRHMLVFAFEGTAGASAGSVKNSITFKPRPAMTDRGKAPKGYKPNPAPKCGTKATIVTKHSQSGGGVQYCEQNLLAGGGWATQWATYDGSTSAGADADADTSSNWQVHVAIANANPAGKKAYAIQAYVTHIYIWEKLPSSPYMNISHM